MAEPITRFWLRFTVMMAVGIGGLAAAGFLLPSSWSARKHVVVTVTSPDGALRLISDPSEWPNWTVWNARDIAGFDIDEVTTDDEGKQIAIWSAPSLGRARLTLDPVERADDAAVIRYRLEFLGESASRVDGRFEVRQQGEHYAIHWYTKGQLHSNPLARWAGITLLKWMAGSDLEESLAVLQEHLERTTDAVVEPSGH